MTATLRKCIMALGVALWLGLAPGALPAAAAAPQDAPAAAPADAEPAKGPELHFQVEEKHLDRAGESLGKNIDRLGAKASDRVGGWIAAEAFQGITWMKLIVCLGLMFLVVVVERVLRALLQKRIRDIPTREGVISWWRIFLEALARPLSLFVWAYGLYGAISPLFEHFRQVDGANLVHAVAQKGADIAATLALVWFAYNLVHLIDERLKRWAIGSESTIDDMLMPLIGKTLRVFILLVGGMVVIQNLTRVEIGPLLASLGIGGLAVALAAKDSIANFFGTLTILFDKPFQVGERVVIDSHDGVVENVGFRSSRIRTLTGHLVTIPNEKLVNSTVENIGKRPNIRWLADIGITYDTPTEKVEAAVAILREILADHEGMHPDFPPRAYFNGFKDWSLNISVVAWYHPADWWSYSAWLERTCLTILRRFREADIDFAFPSQTVYVAGDDRRRLKLNLGEAESAGENLGGADTRPRGHS
jgi:MscS family membrane protein